MIINNINIQTNAGREDYVVVPDNTGIANTIISLLRTIQGKDVLNLTIEGLVVNPATPESTLGPKESILDFKWEKGNVLPIDEALHAAFLR